jgi:hypothetical protein
MISIDFSGTSVSVVSNPKKKTRSGCSFPVRVLAKKMPATCYFPVRLHSIIAAGALNFRVRDGNGCFLPAVVTGKKDAHARVESAVVDFTVFEAVLF